MSFYGFLADVIVGIHLAYVSYAVFGQLAIFIGWPLGWRWIRNPWFRITHLIMILVVALEATVEFECPLTTWENDLRIAAGQRVAGAEAPDAGFIGGLMRRVMFFDSSWWRFLNTCYIIAGLIVLATLFLVPPRFRRPAVPSTPAHVPLDGDAHHALRRADDA